MSLGCGGEVCTSPLLGGSPLLDAVAADIWSELPATAAAFPPDVERGGVFVQEVTLDCVVVEVGVVCFCALGGRGVEENALPFGTVVAVTIRLGRLPSTPTAVK